MSREDIVSQIIGDDALLERMSDALLKENASEWISVKDRLPEIGVMVLMHRPPKYMAIMSLRYWDDRFWWENHRGELTEVYDNDYWMPLPEPPKEEE